MGYVVSSKDISIKAKRIKVVKNWLEPKSVCNIQVFLGFANFYWQFIQSFSKIAILFILMLKTTGSPDKLTPNRNSGSKSASNRNNDNKLVSEKNNNDNEVIRFGIGRNGVEYAKKSRKLSKLGKSKSEKMSKF